MGTTIRAKICAIEGTFAPTFEDNYWYEVSVAPGGAPIHIVLNLSNTNLKNHISLGVYAKDNPTNTLPNCYWADPRSIYDKKCHIPASGTYIVGFYTDGVWDDVNQYTLTVSYP